MKQVFQFTFALALILGLGIQAHAQCSASKSTNAETPQATFASQKPDIVDLAADTDFLSTLVAAVKAGGLVDVLKGDGPFTVFAPTNDAFAALPAGTLDNLLKPENKAQLVDILTYHVVSGKIKSTDLSNGQMAKTVQGENIRVRLNDKGVYINNAQVTAADIEASNGIVHVINKVILPPSK